MKPLHLVLGLVVLAVLVAGVAMLLHEPGGADGSTVVVRADERDDPEPDSGLEATAATASRLDAATALPVEVAEVDDERGMPASYRAALGGLIGRVVEEDGDPVVDVPLSLLGGGAVQFLPALDQLTRTGSVELTPELGTTRTDAEGRFRFDDIDPRTLGVVMVDPGGPRTHLHLMEETPVSGETRDLGDIVLPAGVTVVGRVVDERSEPIPGVRVRATDLQPMILSSGVADFRAGGGVFVEEGEIAVTVVPPRSLQKLESMLPFPTTLTDADGRFELPSVHPGLISVVLDDNVHLTSVEGPSPTGSPGSTLDLGELVMPDGLTQRGRVIDAAGEPVPGAEVMVGNQLIFGPVAVLRPPLRADAEGRFEVSGLAPGAARAVARASSEQAFTGDTGAGVPGEREVIVRLPPRRTLTLELVDVDGEPVEGVTLHARMLPMEAASEMPDWLVQPSRMGDVVRDEQARYVLADLDPGTWDVTIAPEGHGIVRRSFDLSLADHVERVELQRARTLTIDVVDMDGEPVEYALITARATDDRRDMPQPATAERTDADGRAVLSGLRDADYALEIVHPAYAVTSVGVSLTPGEMTSANAPVEVDEAGDGRMTLGLLEGGTIRGTVLDNGAAPAVPLMVTLVPENEDEIVAAALPRMTLTRPDGSFVFHDVEPGSMELQARQRFEFTSLMNWWEPLAMTPEAETEVWVEGGKEVEAILEVGSAWADMDTGFVHGRLVVNGYPAEGWKVRTWGKIRRSATTDARGEFTMGQLAAGQVVLLFNAEANSSFGEGTVDTHTFELPVNGREFVDVSLVTGSVEGRVRSGLDGLPLAGAQVRLEAVQQERSGWWGGRGGATITDAQGHFRFDTVAEGEYTVQANADGFARSASAPFEVRSLQTARNIEVELVTSVVVAGRVVFEGLEEQPNWCFLNAVAEDGGEANARVERESFTFRMDDVAPGKRWTFHVWTNLGGDYKPVDVFVSGPEDDLVLTFREAEPEPPEPPDEDDEGVEQTESLSVNEDR